MEIKDYLHLYIGCEAKVLIQYQQSGSQWVSCKIVGIDNGIPKVRPRDIHGNDWDEDTLRSEVKPILRRLSDMTEKDGGKAFGDAQKFRMYKKEREENNGDLWLFTPNETRKLLQLGFDLYDLIDSGLAIDKSTLGI